MRLAVVGSRGISHLFIDTYLPDGVTEIVSGGAKGVDRLAADFARRHGIALREFLPEYSIYGRGAPLKRNPKIAEYADEALVFWDGASRGTTHTIELFRRLGKKITLILINKE